MGPHETSVIDEEATVVAGQQPPAVGGSAPNATGRTRRLVVAVAVAAVAAVAAGAVVWSTAGGNPAPAGRADAATAPSSESATPTLPAPVGAGTTADATSASAVPSARTAGPTVAQPAAALLPAGWESRSFQGVTFAVPAGAQAPDVLDPGNADAPPTFVWTGPSLGDGVNAQISVWIYPAAQAPELGAEYQPITVPGADQAHARTGVIGSEPALTALDVHVLSGGRFINLVGMFAAGPAGEQMTRELIASLSIG